MGRCNGQDARTPQWLNCRFGFIQANLAEDFQAELERSRSVIARTPDTWPQYLYGTQRYLLKRFPYFVVYRVSTSRIEITAIAHERQQPGYWADRTPQQ